MNCIRTDPDLHLYRHCVKAISGPASRLAAMAVLILAAVSATTFTSTGDAATLEPLRVGVLQFGTVSWEVDVVEHHRLAESEGVKLEVVPLSSANALNVALQSSDVDMVVGDWIWVSRQRAAGREFTSVPYSLAVGELLVQKNLGIRSLKDLSGKRLGVAGGPVDKSWLLLRAYARQTLGEDLASLVTPIYAAPPLLNELALKGDLPAVLNYWHYAARLEAAGMRPLIDVNQVFSKLGIKESVPLLVWVFDESWAQDNRDVVNGFLRATYKAKQILAESEAEWQRIEPLTGAENDAILRLLRDAYRQGIPRHFGAAEIKAAGQVFEVLAREGGSELVGPSTELSPGTFWQEFNIGSMAR
jgi:NitT/TauT family transport system substrate-binding protein